MLQILTHGEQLVVDSRLVADELGIKHKNFLETIRKYHDEIAEFGRVAFQTDTLPTAGGIQLTTFVYLNEDQATYVMTLSRNTDTVRSCKRNLVKAFSQAKQVIKEIIPQQNQELEYLKTALEFEREKNRGLDRLDSMLTIHGKEIVLAISGKSDQVVRVETVVTEIVDIEKGTTQQILTANQLKSEVKKRTGQNLKSQSYFVEQLRKAGRDDLIVPVDRRVTAEYVIPDKLDEAISVVYSNNKQRLLGE